MEGLRRAVEEVLEANPRSDATIGSLAMGLEQLAVRFERLEVVEPFHVGHVGNERRADADGLGCTSGALHEPPHVHDGRRAGTEALRVAEH